MARKRHGRPDCADTTGFPKWGGGGGGDTFSDYSLLGSILESHVFQQYSSLPLKTTIWEVDSSCTLVLLEYFVGWLALQWLDGISGLGVMVLELFGVVFANLLRKARKCS